MFAALFVCVYPAVTLFNRFAGAAVIEHFGAEPLGLDGPDVYSRIENNGLVVTYVRTAVCDNHVANGELSYELIILYGVGVPYDNKIPFASWRQKEQFPLDAPVLDPVEVMLLDGYAKYMSFFFLTNIDLLYDSRPYDESFDIFVGRFSHIIRSYIAFCSVKELPFKSRQRLVRDTIGRKAS